MVASVTPSTNPAATVINNAISLIAAGNSVIFAPHPAAKKVSQRAITLLNQAIVAAGGPENLLVTVANPDIETAQRLFKFPGIGLLVVTGGEAVVEAARKHTNKRLIAAGAGNPPVVVDETADLAQQPGQTDALDPASRGLSRYISEYGPYPAWKNSTAKYYPCGEAMYPDLLADLEKAERFIFLEFFIVRTGKMWKGVEDILVRKAAQGVDVRLIYDDFGSLLGLPSDFVVKMERAHIRCIPFNPVVPLVSLVMNHRDHRKIVVVDNFLISNGDFI